MYLKVLFFLIVYLYFCYPLEIFTNIFINLLTVFDARNEVQQSPFIKPTD